MGAAGERRIYGLAEWEALLDRLSMQLLGITGEEFEQSYREEVALAGNEAHLGAILAMVRRLRESMSDPDRIVGR